MAGKRFRKICHAARDRPVYIRAGLAAVLSVLLFTGLYVWDNSHTALEKNEAGQTVIGRGSVGEDITRELHVRAGETEDDLEIRISGRTYQEEELDQVFDRVQEQLPGLILNGNKSTDEVRTALSLITEIPDTGLRVSWEMDRYDVIDLQGNIIAEELPEEGTVVQLTAVLAYEGRQQTCEFGIRVLPEILGEEEELIRSIREEAGKADEENRDKDYLILPERAGGRKLYWTKSPESRAFGILVLGLGGAAMMIASDRQKRKEKEKNDLRQMQIDYPRIINKFNLYIRAGMTVRKAWFRIAEDYQTGKGTGAGRKAYDEMTAAMYQIRGGLPEGECYEAFGARCGEQAYRRFGLLLSQNLRKGSGGLTDLLEREASDAFEDRKKLAKKLGEEAGTKLMIPMFMMLVIVLIIVIVPAFFSIQI